MSEKEYLEGLKALIFIQKQIDALGMVAAINYKSQLEKLTAPVLQEALKRAQNG